MLDRFDLRPDDHEPRASCARNKDGRGAGSDRDDDSAHDPRDVFTRDLDLPHGGERHLVRGRDRDHELDGTDSRLLSRLGAFRVVAESDLRDLGDTQSEGQRSVRHLEDEGLIRIHPLSIDDRAVVLTERGLDVLEANRQRHDDRHHEPRQVFYAGVRKPRELTHDTDVYRAYARAEARLREDARVHRVVLDYELKREYQQFLQAHNRGRSDSDGRPDRTPEEIAQWARERQLPCDDGHVQFPDARVEYEDRDGRSRHEDLEVVTGHYRGAHGAAAAQSGFTCSFGGGVAVGGRGGRRASDPRFAEKFLR